MAKQKQGKVKQMNHHWFRCSYQKRAVMRQQLVACNWWV